MQISEFIAQRTGRSAEELFNGPTPLVRIEQRDGEFVVVHWDVALEATEPTSEELAEAMTSLPTKPVLVAYAADRRFRAETAGITVAGINIATDDRSKQMIIGARIAAASDPNFTTKWAVGGETFTLNSEQMVGISNAVLAHVGACFDMFAEVSARITAGTMTTKAEVDAAFASIT